MDKDINLSSPDNELLCNTKQYKGGMGEIVIEIPSQKALKGL
jgi:hypothetical protein